MEIISEFLRLYLPTIASTVMTIFTVLIVVLKVIRVLKMNNIRHNKEVAELKKELAELIKTAHMNDIRQDMLEVRNDIALMMGKAPKDGGAK